MMAALAEFSDIIQGGRHKKSGKHFVSEGYPAYGAGGLNGHLPEPEFDRPGIVLSSIGARCGKCFLPEARQWSSLANTQLIFPDPEKADIKFVWYQLNDESSWIRRGTGQPYIRPADVKSREIYFPPLDEQRRIAAILDKADAIRRKREQALAFADDLLKSTFLEMFGDEIERAFAEPKLRLCDLIDSDRGVSYGIVQRGKEVEGGTPIARISNIASNYFDASACVRTDPEISRKFSRTILHGGELLLSIRGTVGRVAVATDAAKGWNVSREVAVIPLLPHVDKAFVHRYMLSTRAQRFMTDNVKGIAQRGINLRDVRELPIPEVSGARLVRFSEFATRFSTAKRRGERQMEQADKLFASLSQRAFRGEL